MDVIDIAIAKSFAAKVASETDTKLAAKAPAGQNYVETLDGTRIYVGSTTPTGTIPTGSVWIGG